jgi:hypothetical protein
VNESFSGYLRDIAISNTLQDKIDQILQSFAKIYPVDFEDIFIEDYVREDGTRDYDSLYFFSSAYWMEAATFTSMAKLAFFNFPTIQVEIESQDYDFEHWNEKSRLLVKFYGPQGQSGQMRAAKKNCDYLRDILRKWLVPQVQRHV